MRFRAWLCSLSDASVHWSGDLIRRFQLTHVGHLMRDMAQLLPAQAYAQVSCLSSSVEIACLIHARLVQPRRIEIPASSPSPAGSSGTLVELTQTGVPFTDAFGNRDQERQVRAHAFVLAWSTRIASTLNAKPFFTLVPYKPRIDALSCLVTTSHTYVSSQHRHSLLHRMRRMHRMIVGVGVAGGARVARACLPGHGQVGGPAAGPRRRVSICRLAALPPAASSVPPVRGGCRHTQITRVVPEETVRPAGTGVAVPCISLLMLLWHNAAMGRPSSSAIDSSQ